MVDLFSEVGGFVAGDEAELDCVQMEVSSCTP